MTFALPEGGALTLQKLESQQDRKRTLGQFLTALKKLVELDEGFDAMLDEFLEKRNLLIHRIDEIPGWSLNTGPRLIASRRFLDRLLYLNDVVLT